jgi:hypothetical protein
LAFHQSDAGRSVHVQIHPLFFIIHQELVLVTLLFSKKKVLVGLLCNSRVTVVTHLLREISLKGRHIAEAFVVPTLPWRYLAPQ